MTAPVSQGTASISQGVAPVSQGTASVSQGTAPVSHRTAPVQQGIAPISQGEDGVSGEVDSVSKGSSILDSDPVIEAFGGDDFGRGSRSSVPKHLLVHSLLTHLLADLRLGKLNMEWGMERRGN